MNNGIRPQLPQQGHLPEALEHLALRFQPGLHVVDRVTLNGFGASFRQSLDFLAVKAIATAQCREQWLELFLRAIPLREGLEDLT